MCIERIDMDGEVNEFSSVKDTDVFLPIIPQLGCPFPPLQFFCAGRTSCYRVDSERDEIKEED